MDALDRSDLYLTLAVAFAPPTPQLVKDIDNGCFHDAFDRFTIGLSLPGTARLDGIGRPHEGGMRLFQMLEVDYVRLFVSHPGGVAAPPYAGYYLDHTMGGPTPRRLQSLYTQSGVVLRENFTEPADHVGVIFEFLRLITQDPVLSDPHSTLPIERRILREFLSPWLSDFAGRVRAADGAPFYVAVAEWSHLAVEALVKQD